MMWSKLNKADKTLLAAAVIFAFALCLNMEYKGNVFARGFLFCAEAALVGGIADWFAVTALFRKPLGFPWHTAILPRRRKSFIEATGRMLQKEFFGRRTLVKKIKKIDFAARLLIWLEEKQQRQRAAAWLGSKLPLWIHQYGSQSGQELKGLSQLQLETRTLQPMIAHGLVQLSDYVAKPEFKEKVNDYLEAYIDSKLKGPMAMMMAGFAQSMNIVNVEEASELIQKRLEELLKLVREENTTEYEQFHSSLENLFAFYEKNLAVRQELNAILLNKLGKLNFGEYLLKQNDLGQGQVVARLQQLLEDLIGKLVELLKANATLQNELNGLIYQLAARGALQARDMLGNIANDVLGTMTDEQINRLVYDKAEPDLLWIRMNGSIVGATIGLFIFVVMQFI